MSSKINDKLQDLKQNFVNENGHQPSALRMKRTDFTKLVLYLDEKYDKKPPPHEMSYFDGIRIIVSFLIKKTKFI